jgi:hypothetical protein
MMCASHSLHVNSWQMSNKLRPCSRQPTRNSAQPHSGMNSPTPWQVGHVYNNRRAPLLPRPLPPRVYDATVPVPLHFLQLVSHTCIGVCEATERVKRMEVRRGAHQPHHGQLMHDQRQSTTCILEYHSRPASMAPDSHECWDRMPRPVLSGSAS